MDTFRNRVGDIFPLGGMARELVGRHLLVPAFRYIHNRIYPLHMVEEKQVGRRPLRHELGRRHRLRHHPGLLRIRLHRSELSDTLQLPGEDPPHGRLSVGEQIRLRPARAQCFVRTL